MILRFIFSFMLASSLNVYAMDNLTSLNSNGIEKWESKRFSGESIYTVVQHKGQLALKSVSNNSASGLMLEQKVDLLKTPYLNWRWLIEKQLSPLDEQSKEGDDFAARIYVVLDGGMMLWKTKSLNYVWSSNQALGNMWGNPFAADNVKMLSVKGKEAQTGKWYEEKRNVYQDLISAFGDKGSEKANQKAYRYIDIIAIMTDTDNSQKQAESYYGDIIFTEI